MNIDWACHYEPNEVWHAIFAPLFPYFDTNIFLNTSYTY